MKNEKKTGLKKRVGEILKVLRKTYPDAHCELDHSSPLELLVATILSAQCTDKRVNLVTPKLFAKYPKAIDYAEAELHELEEDIRSTGFFRNKAKNIQSACRAIVEKFQGRFPDTMEELVQLDGVGRKTANVILGTAFNKNEGVVVDTHVIRLSNLLELTQHKDPVKIEQDLMKLIPQESKSFVSSKGKLPVKIEVTGDDKSIIVNAQVKSDDANHFSPVVIKKLVNKSGLLNLSLNMKGNQLVIEDAGLYIMSRDFTSDMKKNLNNAQKLAEVYGEISDLSSGKIKKLEVLISEPLVLGLPTMPKTTLKVNSFK